MSQWIVVETADIDLTEVYVRQFKERKSLCEWKDLRFLCLRINFTFKSSGRQKFWLACLFFFSTFFFFLFFLTSLH